KGNLYIENLIEQAIESEEEQISFFNYEDIDYNNNNPPEMLSAIAYFKPFDWIIVSAARVDEIEESSTNLRNGFFKIIIIFFVALTLVLVAVFFVGLSVSKRISKPITESATIMNEIAKGKINNALVKLDELNRWYSKQS
ncbi:MAG: cache domain-containing protein, partial [Candidatus Kapabacteria bacterium]|nr:cache domain-containing protein [Candidatus Kapabacteria bacterium]